MNEINRGLSPIGLLVRVGVACLSIMTLLFIFWSATLNLFAETLYPRQLLINLIKDYPGFNQDWLSVASFITVSAYVYGYLALSIFTSNFLYLHKANARQLAGGRDQWNILSYVIVERPGHKQRRADSLSLTEDHRNISSVIRDYSKSSEGIGSIVLDMVTVMVVSYIGYSSLQTPPAESGLLARFIDALLVGFWCYLIFSIFMWFVFVLVAWFQYRDRRV